MKDKTIVALKVLAGRGILTAITYGDTTVYSTAGGDKVAEVDWTGVVRHVQFVDTGRLTDLCIDLLDGSGHRVKGIEVDPYGLAEMEVRHGHGMGYSLRCGSRPHVIALHAVADYIKA